MLEQYAIRLRTISHVRNELHTDRNGRPKWKSKCQEMYKTDAGEFLPVAWRETVRKKIMEEGKTQLLEQIKDHCRSHCVWLKNENEIEEHAMECLCSRAYLYWTDFEAEEMEEIIWM